MNEEVVCIECTPDQLYDKHRGPADLYYIHIIGKYRIKSLIIREGFGLINSVNCTGTTNRVSRLVLRRITVCSL